MKKFDLDDLESILNRPTNVVRGPFPTDGERKENMRRGYAAYKVMRKEKRRALVAHHSNKRKAAKIQQTPRWASDERIKEKYNEAARLTREMGEPYHVDHIVPLRGEKVCGLHCEDNLQVIPAAENLRKYNFFEI